jgi:hypothetical protein
MTILLGDAELEEARSSVSPVQQNHDTRPPAPKRVHCLWCTRLFILSLLDSLSNVMKPLLLSFIAYPRVVQHLRRQRATRRPSEMPFVVKSAPPRRPARSEFYPSANGTSQLQSIGRFRGLEIRDILIPG